MINGSAAKHFRRSTQGNGPSLPKKREQKQLDKKVGQKAIQEVRFSNQQVLVDSENKAHHVQLHTPGGNQMSFGKELDSIHRQQLSITASTAQSSGNDPRTLDSSQAKLLQLNISRYQPPPFDSSQQGSSEIFKRPSNKKPSQQADQSKCLPFFLIFSPLQMKFSSQSSLPAISRSPLLASR
jgi:hypothetical protein